MQNPIQKFGKSSIVIEKPGILSEKNQNLWRAPTTIDFNIFCWSFAHCSFLPMSTKGCSKFFFFLILILSYLQKLKRSGFYTLVFYIFTNNSKSKQNKENPEHPLVGIRKRAQNFNKKYKALWLLELVKIFNVSGKWPGFSQIIEFCRNVCIGFCRTWLVLLNNKQKSLKSNFELTIWATLKG